MPESPPRRRGLKLAAAAGATAIGTLLVTSGVAWAEKSPAPDTSTVEGLGIATNILWVVIGAVLVIFMQAGFALVETGFCRAKHAAHVVSARTSPSSASGSSPTSSSASRSCSAATAPALLGFDRRRRRSR